MFFFKTKIGFLNAKDFLIAFWLFCKNILSGMSSQPLIISSNIADSFWLCRTIITTNYQNITNKVSRAFSATLTCVASLYSE